jgi:hypothetical protein
MGVSFFDKLIFYDPFTENLQQLNLIVHVSQSSMFMSPPNVLSTEGGAGVMLFAPSPNPGIDNSLM